MHELPNTTVIESIVRRHLPACFALDRVELASHDATSDNPAPFRVIATIQRINADPDPGGWGYELACEVRAGWDITEFSLEVNQLPSDFDDVVGWYSDGTGTT
jgi:hypothetical protein